MSNLRVLHPPEARILTEYARGWSPTDTATRLGITIHTLHWTMREARRRLGAKTTLHLFALALAAGDIDPDSATGTAGTSRPRGWKRPQPDPTTTQGDHQ